MASVAAGYLPILLFLAVALALSAAFVVLPMAVSRLTGTHKPDPEKLSEYECGFPAFEDSRAQFDVRFYRVTSKELKGVSLRCQPLRSLIVLSAAFATADGKPVELPFQPDGGSELRWFLTIAADGNESQSSYEQLQPWSSKEFDFDTKDCKLPTSAPFC